MQNKYNSRRRPAQQSKKLPVGALLTVIVVVFVLLGVAFLATSPLLTSEEAGITKEMPDSTAEINLLKNIDDPFLQGWEPKPAEERANILLLGLDDQGMSDFIMIVSYSLDSYEGALVSLKRDTYVPDQDWAPKNSGQDHLAWAYNRGLGREGDHSAGAELAAATVEDMLDIDLHAYASITFDGFVELVDLLGGVTIEVSPEFADRQGTTLPVGLQHLSGEEALVYARHRQNPRIPEPGSTSEDGDRVRRNQRLLKALLEAAKEKETDELLNIVKQLEENFFTSLDDWDLLELLNILYNRDLEGMQTAVLPGEGERVYQERIEREIYYYYLDYEASDLLLQELGIK